MGFAAPVAGEGLEFVFIVFAGVGVAVARGAAGSEFVGLSLHELFCSRKKESTEIPASSNA